MHLSHRCNNTCNNVSAIQIQDYGKLITFYFVSEPQNHIQIICRYILPYSYMDAINKLIN